jgi:hypothetical protein
MRSLLQRRKSALTMLLEFSDVIASHFPEAP